MSEEEVPEYYDTQQVAHIFRVEGKTVVRWDEQGKFAEHGVNVERSENGRRRFKREEIHQLFAKMLDGQI